MRDWNLGPGDPLNLTISADFRLCEPDFLNDHTWEVEIGGSEPPGMALATTYGLRARAMRIFPRFRMGSVTITNPKDFARPPRLRRFYPNYLHFDFSPFDSLETQAEYWIPDSQRCSGRISVKNTGGKRLTLFLELCAHLAPLEEGIPLAPVTSQLANVLQGRTGDLYPVIFMTGGPQPGPGPAASLGLEVNLEAGESRTLTWCEAALGNPQASLEQARLTAARNWEAELLKIEMINAAGTVEIHTGEPDWDAALALSQKAALGMFFNAPPPQTSASFVRARTPDHGYARPGGGEAASAWSGQTPLESNYIASLLPALPELAEGLVRNFLATQAEDGFVRWKAGAGGQGGRFLAAPMLAGLAWRAYQQKHDKEFLREVQPKLAAFLERWFDAAHDRDGDGFPEWDHLLQAGLEDAPTFTVFHAAGQGLDISAVENPGLAALLCHDLDCLGLIAGELSIREEQRRCREQVEKLREKMEACWDERAGLYRNRDRDSHLSNAGKNLGSWRGAGTLALNQSFAEPARLLVRILLKGGTTMRPVVTLRGRNGETPVQERLERLDFKWGTGLAVATSRQLYTALDSVEIEGLEGRDRVYVCTAGFTSEDISLLLPLLAGTLDEKRAERLVRETIQAPERFGGRYGMPTCLPEKPTAGLKPTPAAQQEQEAACQAVHMPWNALIGFALARNGFRTEAAELCGRLMEAVTRNLKQQHAFQHAYSAAGGSGMGERNELGGLAPVGLFLEALGVRIESARRVALAGKNPFPWDVTVKYRGLSVTRQGDKTIVTFPDGRTTTLHDPTEAVVSID